MAELMPAGWPFLVARTVSVGYRLVLAPRVLVEAGRQDLISRAVAPDDDLTGPAVRTIQADAWTFSLVYRTHRVTVADGPVLDEHGRPILLVFGFVCAGVVDSVAEVDLAVARARALEAYRRVVRGSGPTGVEPAEPFALASSVRSSALRPPPADRGHRSRRLVLAAALAAAVLAVGGWALFRPAARPDWSGTWQGQVAGRALTVALTCADQCRQVTGTVTDSAGCSSDVRLRSASGTSVRLALTGTCQPAGGITLSTTSSEPDTATLSWFPDDSTQHPTLTGTLRRGS